MPIESDESNDFEPVSCEFCGEILTEDVKLCEVCNAVWVQLSDPQKHWPHQAPKSVPAETK